jgi:GT2 family glycosyltransferase
MLKVAVITVLFKGEEVLEGFYKSLSVQTDVDITVYAIDNSPTPTGTKLCEELGVRYGVRTITVFNNANLGVAKGNNQGIKLAQASGFEWIILSNNDVEFSHPSMFTGMIAEMGARDARCSVPKMLYFGTRVIWCAGGRISKLRAGAPHIGDMETDSGQYDEVGFTGYAPTCFMVLHRSVFEEVGLMDEQYFVYYDDTDFVFRMAEKRINVLYDPRFELFHKVSFSTGGNESLFSLYYLTRNRLFFSRKNFSLPYRAISVAYTLAAMIVKSRKFDEAQRRQVFKAVREGLTTQMARIVS